MSKIGVVGLGDMGSGLAKNLIGAGLDVVGYDLSEPRMRAFVALGGAAAGSVAEVGRACGIVYVMVLDGRQAKSVALGDGLAATMAEGGTVILTATIKPSEAREIGEGLAAAGIDLIDSPVSGGYAGAQNGTLTMMAAGAPEVLERCRPAMAAVSAIITHVGREPGMGQTVKACLQSVMGSIVAATAEAAALAAKAGIRGDDFHKVLTTSAAASPIANATLTNIIDRKFHQTGSHISTLYKDVTITMDTARDLGVPLFTASAAMQLLQAAKTKYVDADNWIVTRITEEIVGAELHRGKASSAEGKP